MGVFNKLPEESLLGNAWHAGCVYSKHCTASVTVSHTASHQVTQACLTLSALRLRAPGIEAVCPETSCQVTFSYAARSVNGRESLYIYCWCWFCYV
jgi:hypothetical protein